MENGTEKVIEFSTRLMRDGETFGVRYVCDCGCRPQVRLKRGAPSAHEHCCCGIAHAAGPDARAHLEAYLIERRAQGLDTDLTYAIHESEVRDPWDGLVPVAYAIPARSTNWVRSP